LGGRIQIDEEQRVKLLSYYDSFMGLARDEDSTFIISSTAHLIRLRDLANNERTNKLLLEKNVYRQVGPIDMNEVIVDRVSGWMPIGLEPTTAFRGTFIGDDLHPIKNLKINRGNTLGVGLFGYVQNFTAKNVTLQKADVKGHSFAGILAGAVVTSGNSRDQSYFVDCELIDCKLQGADDGLSVGGLVGMVDQYADVFLLGCTTKNSSCVGAYNVGGFLGGSGRSSRIFMTDCVNENTPVLGKFHCVGGLIGVADSLSMSLCINKADVIGGTDSSTGTTIYGTGGLAGGAGTAVLLACKNFASVKGDLGVGGLIGSSRVATDEQEHAVFGNVFFQQCMNEGDVEGTDGVGGICGESQFGGHGLYNGGTVLGDKYVGGLCGKTSVAVAQNSINRGEVVGNSRIGGLIGIVSSGSITLSQNLGIVKASTGYVGGVVGLMGDNGIVHYCANYAPLECTGSSPVGGIVGEVGDPRKWSNTDITYCVFGAINMAMGPWSAAIDLAGFTTISTIDTVVSLVLGGTGFALRTYFTYMESVKEVLDFRGCFDDVEFSRKNDEISKKE
ncbi:MAG: hypothetical protein IKU98_02575, partial [Bacteroidaceae bacterium]|nr:hypothetical protein [Bacteroidaceae bacterium]